MSDRVGAQFGKYHLIRLLGQGASSYVYLGEHLEQGGQVAIKILNTSLTEDQTEAYLTEGHKITRLDHPHIRRTLDAGVEKGTPFLVLEYAPHGTLRERHPIGQPLPPATIAPYVKQITEALHYAHAHKMIHGDIKPENLLLGRDHQVLVNDFSQSLITLAFGLNPSQLPGTVNYIAPEQFEGNPRFASDQYSLALVIYEWLCGEQPFQGSITQIASEQLFAEPPPLRQKIPALSPAIENVILTALSKDWQDRYASIQAFARAFERACSSDAVVTASALGPPEHASKTIHGQSEDTPAETTSSLETPPEPVAGPIYLKGAGQITPGSPARTSVFISYSHIDKRFLEQLHTHLKLLEKDGGIDYWDDTRLVPGANWREEINKAIASAKIAIFLVSADFLASDFITHQELPLLLAAKEAGANILSVILKDCLFEESPLSKFQTVNGLSRPLSAMPQYQRDKVWTNLARLMKLQMLQS